MAFVFTVAIMPEGTSLKKDIQYIKSALLYADKVRLVSPVAYLFVQLTSQSNNDNERSAVYLLNQVMPLAKLKDMSFYNSNIGVVEQFSHIVNSKKYKSLPFVKKMEIRNQLKQFTSSIYNVVYDLIGVPDCKELEALIKSNQVIVEKFDNSIGDLGKYAFEYLQKLRSSLSSSYPLFDDQSNDLMNSVLKTQIVRLSDVDKQKIVHAGLADNYVQRLPSFESASVDEIIDIKKALNSSVVRFRSKMIGYSEQVKSLPWDEDFGPECQMLFDREVAPTILEIEEATRENSFVRNLGRQIFEDEKIWQKSAGIAVSIASPGVIQSVLQTMASDISGFLSVGSLAVPTAVLGQKLYNAYSTYGEKKRVIENNDLFFYYKAGKLLDKG